MILNRAAAASFLRAGTARFGARSAAAPTVSGSFRHGSTSGSGIPASMLSNWYNVFGKSNVMYISWVVAGILVAEGITGSGTDALWNSVNKGRTYDSVDWSKFVVEDDDDEDEDEDEEEDDDDDDDDDE